MRLSTCALRCRACCTYTRPRSPAQPCRILLLLLLLRCLIPSSWLLSLACTIPPPTPQVVLRIWDCLVVEGAKVAHRVAIALLKVREEGGEGGGRKWRRCARVWVGVGLDMPWPSHCSACGEGCQAGAEGEDVCVLVRRHPPCPPPAHARAYMQQLVTVGWCGPTERNGWAYGSV